jgi:hypothetical protein
MLTRRLPAPVAVGCDELLKVASHRPDEDADIPCGVVAAPS